MFNNKQTPYEEKHHFDNQLHIIEGVPVNPVMRTDFDNTPNGERDELEINHWWDKPFIVTHTVDNVFLNQETYEQYISRLKKYEIEPSKNRQEFDSENKHQVDLFMARYPDGIQYEVRCLDGGAWDRSTWKGSFASIGAALHFLGVEYGDRI